MTAAGPRRHRCSPLQGHPGSLLRQGAGTWPEAGARNPLCPHGCVSCAGWAWGPAALQGALGSSPCARGARSQPIPESAGKHVTPGIHTRAPVTLTNAPSHLAHTLHMDTRLPLRTSEVGHTGRGRGHQASGGCLPSGARVGGPTAPGKQQGRSGPRSGGAQSPWARPQRGGSASRPVACSRGPGSQPRRRGDARSGRVHSRASGSPLCVPGGELE